MRTFVLSDIHGENELFRKALKAIGLKKTDRLILLGDLIDRGRDSKGVLDTIFLLLESGFNIDCLLGNHEKMFLDAQSDLNSLNQWLLNGGNKTLLSFLTSSIEKIPSKYVNLIKEFKYYLEIEGFVLVHAALNMKIDDPFTDTYTMLWERNPEKLLSEVWLEKRKLIHGHSPQSQQEILDAISNNERIICVDNGAYLKKPGYGTTCILQLETLACKFIK